MALVAYTDEYKASVDRYEGIAPKPHPESLKHPKGIQVLQNRFLERIFASSPWFMPGVWFLPLVGFGLYMSITDAVVPHWLTAVLFVAGVLAWTLLEYLLHRFFFHLNPGKSRFTKGLLFMVHGYHHEYPADPLRLVAPPTLSWPLGAIILSGYYFAIGPHYSFALIAGTAAGYLGYDWIHYYTHHGRPTTRAGKFLRRYHMEHHFKDHDSHHGISSPLWDLLFFTFKAREAAPVTEPEISAAKTASSTTSS